MGGKHLNLVFSLLAAGILLLGSVGCGAKIPQIKGTTYYVDCSRGNDANAGTSRAHPWRSVEKLNRVTFQPGDGIFFKRGTSCQGELKPLGSGAEELPISLGAYGQGKPPVIDGGNGEAAFELRNAQYWEIADLEFAGGSMYGVHITGDAGIGTLSHFRLTNIVVHDVNGGELTTKVSGLVVLASGGENSRLDDVVLDHVTAYNTNQWGGIVVAGLSGDYRQNPPDLSTNVIIRNSVAHHVYGDGIVLWGVQNGLIEHSLAYETGLQPAPQTIGTPSSIWTWMCHDCTVQYNESYAAHSPDVDGGAFDVDWGNVNNLYQYNYGHDTDSYCISVFGSGGLTTTNTVIRYNICSNNGLDRLQASSAGAILLTTWGGGWLDGVQIYNNTIYWNPADNANAIVNQAAFKGDRTNFFKNNLVYSTAGWLLFSNASLKFDHNLYWYPGHDKTTWFYGDELYKGFGDYQVGTGQDAASRLANPMLKDITYHEVGAPVAQFSLLKDSPAIDAGEALEAMGGRDFLGNPMPVGQVDIGACEWQGK